MEKWIDIKGYEGLYQVSDKGNVRSLNYNKSKQIKELKQVVDKYGYLNVCLHKNGKQLCQKVHRLVAIAFIPNINNKPTVDHVDGNKINNNASNLRWATNSENNNNPITKVRMKGIQNGRQMSCHFSSITLACRKGCKIKNSYWKYYD